MYVKKFEAESLDDALKSVKTELGPDAIILKTVTNKGLKGAFKKSRVEITAAISENSYAKKARVDHVLDDVQKEQFYNAPARTINHMIEDYSGNTQQENSNGGYGQMGLNKVVNTVSKASSKIKNSLDDFLSEEVEQAPASKANHNLDAFLSREAREQKTSAAQRVTRTEDRSVQMENTQVEAESRELRQRIQQNNETSTELKDQIKSQAYQIEMLEEKLYQLSQNVMHAKESQEAKGIIGLRNTLRALSLNESIIADIIKKASFELTREELEDADLIYEFALREINGLLTTAMPLFSQADIQDQPVVTVLISDSSAGQSSLALKLAVLQENVKIVQFRTTEREKSNCDFTKRIFDIESESVTSLSHLMSESRAAIKEGKSLILDLRLNFAQTDETRKFIETLRRSFENVEILTTISAINDEIYNRKILTKYNQFSNGVIISNIDQCLNFGALVNLNYEFNQRPLKFFGTGPTVPDDIEAATSERIMAGLFQL